MLTHILAGPPEQIRPNQRAIAMCPAANLHHAMDQGPWGAGPWGDQRYGPSGAPPGSEVCVNAVPVPLQAIVSACQSANSALIFLRLLCVPPCELAPGGVLRAAKTVTPGAEELPQPKKLTVAVDACAGANTIKAVGLVILSAEIGTPPE